jgi:ribosomal protein S18 acetylase RimI-like enzyme
MIKLIGVKSGDNESIALLESLSHTIWNEHYPDIISQEQIDYMLNKYHSFESFSRQIDVGYRYLLVQFENDTIGYCCYKLEDDETIFLNKLYIKKSEQRKGIGNSILNTMLDEIKNYKYIRLQVNRKNTKAINFYLKNGFEIEKIQDFDIGGGFVMEDYVMIKKINV